MTTSDMEILAHDHARIRREAFIRSVLLELQRTVRMRPTEALTDKPLLQRDIAGLMHTEFTDASARVIAPLVEAVEILEAIIFASDGCMGHRDCAHSMEPWQRARALLQGKWDSYEDRRPWPSSEPR